MKTVKTGFLLFGAVLSAAIGTCTAKAGPMYIYVVADPVSTAGAGVAASNGMTVSSNRSGPGTFQVYALDDVTGSFGIKSYNVKLNGFITALLNRSPNGNWVDGDGIASSQGFNDVRTAVAATGTTSGGQGPINSVFIRGIGRTAGDFPTSNPLDVSSTQAAGAAGQWGTYNPLLGLTRGFISGVQRNAVLLAEGSYTGAPPTVDLVTPAVFGGTAVNLLSSAQGSAAFSVSEFSAESPSFSSHVVIDNVNANDPGVVTFDLSPYYPGPPPDDFSLNGPSVANPATLDPITKVFRWNTTGAAIGSYSWHTHSGNNWNPHVDLTVRITAVPEPVALTYFGLTIACVGGLLNRCRATLRRSG